MITIFLITLTRGLYMALRCLQRTTLRPSHLTLNHQSLSHHDNHLPHHPHQRPQHGSQVPPQKHYHPPRLHHLAHPSNPELQVPNLHRPQEGKQCHSSAHAHHHQQQPQCQQFDQQIQHPH